MNGPQCYRIKRGNHGNTLDYICMLGGKPVDLSDATHVQFGMRARDQLAAAKKVDAAGSVANGPAGIARYTWQAGDIDTLDRYCADFKITFSDGTEISFPGGTYIDVEVFEEMAT